jgi:hypothetical protein
MNRAVLYLRKISAIKINTFIKVTADFKFRRSELLKKLFLKLLPGVFLPVLVEEIARINGERAGLASIKKMDELGCIRPSRVYGLLRSLLWKPTYTQIHLENDIKKKVLVHVLHLLETHKIRPFISFGTLLGYVREGDFLEHDLDLDLGIFHDESSCEQVYQILIKNDSIRIVIYEPDPWPSRIKISIPSISRLFTVDLIFFKKIDGKLATYSRILEHPIIRFRSEFELRRGYFGDQPIWVPDPPEIFLDENYPNWETKSEYHHYILTSPFTDFSSDWIRFYTSLTIMTAIMAKSNKLPYLEKLAMEKYSTITPWDNPV